MKLNSGSYKAFADNNAKTFGGYSSFSENFAAGVGQVVDEELSISSFLHDEGISTRNQKIRNLVADGQIEQEIIDSYTTGNPGRGTKVDYNAIAEYINWAEVLDEKLDTDLELTTIRDDELARRRAYRNEVFDTSLTGGYVGKLLGGFTAGSLDPINVGTMFLAAPIAGAKAASKAMYALKAARNSAALNAGVSIPIEPFIHSWKEEIGAEYTLSDSLINIGASGVLGGLVGGLGAAVGKQFTGDSIIGKDRNGLVNHFKKAGMDEDDAETMATFVDEANQAHSFDPSLKSEDFVRKADETMEGMDASNKMDVEPNADTSDAQVLAAQFDRPEVAEGEIQTDVREHVPADNIMKLEDGTEITFREMSKKIDEETETLTAKLGCLNG